MAGVDTTYYLVHSMGSTESFEEQDRTAAQNFAAAAREAGVRRIIYLGGLGHGAEKLSAHLRSRHEVGEVLRSAGVPVVASDLPGMAPVVREAGCGVLVDPTDPRAIAAALRAVLATSPDEMAVWRERCSAAARETYNWERQMDLLLAEYGRQTRRPW